MPTDVVIGAASGMGAAVAARLVERGRQLLAVDKDTCDITSASDVAALVEQVDELGSLVVTAGLSPTMADGRRIVEVNLVAVDALLTAIEPRLVAGSVAVVFASMAAHQIPVDPNIDAILDDPSTAADKLAELGLLDHSGLAYAVSKRGVIRMVERRAKAWGARGARLVSVSPGVIDTPMGRREFEAFDVVGEMIDASALGRQGAADEVAAVAVFLASDAGSFITGTDVLVDGGVIASQRHPHS